jgi:hypothetical protein
VGEAVPRIKVMLQVAMERLEEEFRQLLIRRTALLAANDLQMSLLCQLSSHGVIIVPIQPPLQRPAILGLMVSWHQKR